MKIAIVGPNGAGKSTISDAVAKALGILHLDTGAMYRAAGLSCLRAGIPVEDEDQVTAHCRALDLDVAYADGRQQTLLGGEDVSGLIRTEAVGKAASRVATYGGVRRAMVAAQQRIAEKTSMLVDGRDIGTVVLPDADVKIFLTATAEERAMRRWRELQAKGDATPFEDVLRDLKARDHQDMNRPVDPLRVAEDAVVVDTTELDFDQSVAAIVRLIREKCGAEKEG